MSVPLGSFGHGNFGRSNREGLEIVPNESGYAYLHS
jgi:hypothetical protein